MANNIISKKRKIKKSIFVDQITRRASILAFATGLAVTVTPSFATELGSIDTQTKLFPMSVDLICEARKEYDEDGFLHFHEDGRLAPDFPLGNNFEHFEYREILFFGESAPSEEQWEKSQIKYMIESAAIDFVVMKAFSDITSTVLIPGKPVDENLCFYVLKNMVFQRSRQGKANITKHEADELLLTFMSFRPLIKDNVIELTPMLHFPKNYSHPERTQNEKRLELQAKIIMEHHWKR